MVFDGFSKVISGEPGPCYTLLNGTFSVKRLRAKNNVSGHRRTHLFLEILYLQKHVLSFPKGISQTPQEQPGQEFIWGRGSWQRQQNTLSCRQSYGIPSALLDLSSDQKRETGFISSLCLQKYSSDSPAAAAVHTCPSRAPLSKQGLRQLLPTHPGQLLAEGGHLSPLTATPHQSL